MQKKRLILISTLLISIILLGIGTVAYIRRGVEGSLAGQTGNLVLIVNEANAVRNESFSISLNRSEEEPYVLPDDSGSFNINIDASGSSTDVKVNVNVTRTNLPNNLKFYTDPSHTTEITTQTYKINHAATMTKTIPVYWFWDGSVDDENDTLFMGKTLEANISVTATVSKSTFVDTLIASAASNLDTNVNFKEVSSSTNGQGLMMRYGTQNDDYPIVYYRGNVSNNNVIFADLCWLIVRTTETGEIKLLYNGEVNDDGSCNNYSGVGGEEANTSYTDVYAGNTETAFNTSYKSPVYVGYMYNDTNTYFTSNTLDTTGYKEHLADNSIDSETGRHVQNTTDSTIKGVVDDWYEANILGKPEESLLEDTVWCNDRSVISEKYTIENFSTNKQLSFAANTRIFENTTLTPTLTCNRDVDKFTVETSNGNGDLTYPIGLLTADEMIIVGNNSLTYLSLGDVFGYSMSPSTFKYDKEEMMYNSLVIGRFNNYLTYSYVGNKYGARPMISVSVNAVSTTGDGSFEKPYILS